MIISIHAVERFNKRFPDLDIHHEWASAKIRRTGAETIKRIRKQCPRHKDVTTRTFNGYYYKVSRRNVVFVVAPPEQIVTVFQLKPKEKRAKKTV